MIGEFSQEKCLPDDCKITELYKRAIQNDFAGTLDWSLIGGDGNDDATIAMSGMQSLAHEKDVVVNIV